LTLGTALAVAINVLIYPKLTSAVFPIDKFKIKQKCRLTFSLVFSGALGCLSHVLLDVTNHAYNPVFWPFLPTNATPSSLVPLLGGEVTASLLMHALMTVLFVGLFANKRERFWDQLLIG
jgi:membrane-bound metal-dependent hydrolase YbcI (DUF457 family)